MRGEWKFLALGATWLVLCPRFVDARTSAVSASEPAFVVASKGPLPTIVMREHDDAIDSREGEPSERSTSDAQEAASPRARHAAELDLEQRLKELHVAEGAQGLSVHVRSDHGELDLSPEEYARALKVSLETQDSRGWLYKALNITTAWGILWVMVGVLGQVLFTYRMVVQWLASERSKRSVIPVGYWWGSLLGGMTLLVYFSWRKDIVGIVGQAAPLVIYARNLVLIYRTPPAERALVEGKPWRAPKPSP
jgi:lipid-A-disaccharide synthase-like uncharacterized protein